MMLVGRESPSTSIDFQVLIRSMHHTRSNHRQQPVPHRSVTAIASWALLIWRALESYECDRAAIFRRAGIDPDRLSDPNTRHSWVAQTRLWELSVVETGDPCFGLVAARSWHPSVWHALGFSWQASSTLRDGLERIARYGRLINSAFEATIEIRGEELHFRYGISEGVYNVEQEIPVAVDAAGAVLLTICRSALGEGFTPLRMTLSRPKPNDLEPYERFFRCPLSFPGYRNYDLAVFSRELAEQPLPTADPEVAQHTDSVVRDYLARFDRQNIGLQVRRAVIDLLPRGETTEEEVARRLHMSARSLQRKLKDSGTTYKEIVDEIRRTLAGEYLDQRHLSLTEISFMLGFSDPSNFSRAFRRWYGVAPSAYRERPRVPDSPGSVTKPRRAN